MLRPYQPAVSLRGDHVEVLLTGLGWDLSDPHLILEYDGFAHLS